MFLNLELMPWLDDQVQLPPSRRIITSYNKAKVSLFSGYHHWFGHVPRAVMVLQESGPMKNYIFMKAKDDENCLWKFGELRICSVRAIHYYLHVIAEDRTFTTAPDRLLDKTNFRYQR
jgi:hypothetical protein